MVEVMNWGEGNGTCAKPCGCVCSCLCQCGEPLLWEYNALSLLDSSATYSNLKATSKGEPPV